VRRRRATLEDKMKKAEELEKARLKRLEDYTNAILDWGLWQTAVQIDFHMGTYLKTKTDKTSPDLITTISLGQSSHSTNR
jgi:flagellar motility protein MotE (MotC chaperone)